MKALLVVCMFLASMSSSTAVLSDTAVTTVANKNTATVTVPSSTAIPTDLVSLDLGDVAVGELIFVEAFALLDKGDTAGDTLVLIRSSGTGQVLFATDTIDLEDRRFVPAKGRIQVWLSGIGRVTASGKAVLTMKAASAESNSTSGRSQSQLRAYRFKSLSLQTPPP